MPDLSTVEHTAAAAAAAVADESKAEIEEEVNDFAARLARLVISRAFREGGAIEAPQGGGGGGAPQPASLVASTDPGGGGPGGLSSSRGGERSALAVYAAEAEVSLRGSQRLAAQLEGDADVLRSRVFPALLDNARRLHALYVAIDRAAEEVMPRVEATVKLMEKAVYDLEEFRKEQVDTRAPHGSYGLGVALGAGLWFPQTTENGVAVPEIFDTDELFEVKEGGLAPL